MNKTRSHFPPILSLFVFAHFSHHVITAITVPLLPLIRTSFNLSYTQSGLLLAAFTISFGIAHLLSGWLNRRVGPLVLIAVGIVGVALSGLLIGFAGSFAMLILAQILMGIAGSGYHPAASYFISRVTSPEKRGRALGIHVIGGSASYFLSPLLAAAIAVFFGWRGSFIILAVPAAVLGLAIVVLMRRFSRAASGQDQPLSRDPESGAMTVPWARMTAFLVLSTLTGAIVGSVIGFIPLYLVDRFGTKEEIAAGLLSIIFSSGIWAAPLAGALSDRFGRLRLIIAASVMAGPVVALLAFVPLGFGFYVLLLLIGVFIFVRMPVSEAYIFGSVPERFRSTLLGIYFFGSALGGGALTPVLGRLIDRYSFETSFVAAGALVLALTLICSPVILFSRSSAVKADQV